MSLLKRCSMSGLPILCDEKVHLFIGVEEITKDDLSVGFQNIKHKVLGGFSLSGVMKENCRIVVQWNERSAIMVDLLEQIYAGSLPELIKELVNKSYIINNENEILKLDLIIIKESVWNAVIESDLERESELSDQFEHHAEMEEKHGLDEKLHYRKVGFADFDQVSYIKDGTALFKIMQNNSLNVSSPFEVAGFFLKDQTFLSNLRFLGIKMNESGVLDEGIAFDFKEENMRRKYHENYLNSLNDEEDLPVKKQLNVIQTIHSSDLIVFLNEVDPVLSDLFMIVLNECTDKREKEIVFKKEDIEKYEFLRDISFDKSKDLIVKL